VNDQDIRRYDRARRAQTFGRENAADFTAGSQALTHFTALDAAIQTVDDAKAGQAAGTGNASKIALLDALTIDLRNVRRTAMAIAQDEPGFADAFPAAEHNDTSVITTADAYLAQFEIKPTDSPAVQAAKTALTARFVAHELPATFVADLRTDRDAVGTASGTVEGKRQDIVEDTGAIEVGLRAAAKAIRYLNAIIHNKYNRNPEKLRAWKSATHLERAPERKKKDQPPPAPKQ
jgi:hypothetical protein